jgi:hypothetical protein
MNNGGPWHTTTGEYADRDWLAAEMLTKPVNQIAREVGRSTYCVHRWANIFGLPKRKKGGPRRKNTKLTPESVLKIRASSEQNKVLANRYGVTREHIGNIRKGRSWKEKIE